MVCDVSVIGYRLVTQDGHELGSVKEIRDRLFKVDAPLEPDYWLPADRVRSISDGYVALGMDVDEVDDARTAGVPDGT